ncbi:PorT family protein [Seonamhaeicola algicola]|uniref:PorT family protein n=1 Tax=Seonamhaeicola algicola TaxID=1719036 RepID=A0A5C7AT87_9FLAO|nr:porin family protein [Seonamhaeicola algicola]TXE11527.1 PorT family protein [Seonamhaeicola algicola]
MKKTVLFTLLLVFSVYGFAQEKTIDTTSINTPKKQDNYVFKGVKYGIRGGYNISNLDFEDTPPMINKHRNSIYFGFFAQIGFSKTIAIAPELQFSAEGAKDEKIHLDYIQAPILLKVRLSEKIHVGAGPQVGLKVHKVDDAVNNFAYSAVGAIEYKINYALFADVRYTYGIRNVFEDASGLSAKNTNIQIGVGYKF